MPSEPYTGDDKIIIATAWRTIAAAAKGMRLRDLTIPDDMHDALWKPFAVPSLLPAWVGIRWNATTHWLYWDTTLDWKQHKSAHWIIAAVTLQRALCHMSLLPMKEREGRRGTADSRRLTQSDVQAMHAEFKRNKLPIHSNPVDVFAMYHRTIETAQEMVQGSTVDRYFSWLRNDAKLAQGVADAWNAVVEHGALSHCYCFKCVALRNSTYPRQM